MLTSKQRDLLLFIHDYINTNGISPSFEEMKDALGLKSKSGIHRLVNALVERKFLKRLKNKARALEVERLPSAATVEEKNEDRAVSGTGIGSAVSNNDLVEIPLYGKIAAGTPIEAIQNPTETINVPMNFMGGGECYALTVEGDSMTKAGIMDGDIVIIERCNQARDGEIVVALVDNEEATLKRLRREIGHIILQPENDTYTPITLTPDRVKIQGRLKSLFRHY